MRTAGKNSQKSSSSQRIGKRTFCGTGHIWLFWPRNSDPRNKITNCSGDVGAITVAHSLFTFTAWPPGGPSVKGCTIVWRESSLGFEYLDFDQARVLEEEAAGRSEEWGGSPREGWWRQGFKNLWMTPWAHSQPAHMSKRSESTTKRFWEMNCDIDPPTPPGWHTCRKDRIVLQDLWSPLKTLGSQPSEGDSGLELWD